MISFAFVLDFICSHLLFFFFLNNFHVFRKYKGTTSAPPDDAADSSPQDDAMSSTHEGPLVIDASVSCDLSPLGRSETASDPDLFQPPVRTSNSSIPSLLLHPSLEELDSLNSDIQKQHEEKRRIWRGHFTTQPPSSTTTTFSTRRPLMSEVRKLPHKPSVTVAPSSTATGVVSNAAPGVSSTSGASTTSGGDSRASRRLLTRHLRAFSETARDIQRCVRKLADHLDGVATEAQLIDAHTEMAKKISEQHSRLAKR